MKQNNEEEAEHDQTADSATDASKAGADDEAPATKDASPNHRSVRGEEPGGNEATRPTCGSNAPSAAKHQCNKKASAQPTYDSSNRREHG